MSVDNAMRGLGFADDAAGPAVDELRRSLASRGVTNAGVSWGPEAHTLTDHERAMIFLDVQWQVERGHAAEVKLMDSAPLDWTFSTKTMRWSLRFRPSLIAPWLGDRFRSVVADFRRWRDISVLGLKPPSQSGV